MQFHYVPLFILVNHVTIHISWVKIVEQNQQNIWTPWNMSSLCREVKVNRMTSKINSALTNWVDILLCYKGFCLIEFWSKSFPHLSESFRRTSYWFLVFELFKDVHIPLSVCGPYQLNIFSILQYYNFVFSITIFV